MGTAASVEENPDQHWEDMPPTHQRAVQPVRVDGGYARSAAAGQSGHSGRMAVWKDALKTVDLSQTSKRKMRAAALGRKSACTVKITKSGFSIQHIHLCEGQVITFNWSDSEGKGFNVTQVVHDGEQYKPVIGGFNSGPLCPRGFFEQQFNTAGEYKFVSAGMQCQPLRVEVDPRKDIEALVTDEGFSPRLVRVDEGNAITWAWFSCRMPHSVIEVEYSHAISALEQVDSEDIPTPTREGTFRKEFDKPGLYYFQTEGDTIGELHTCIVHVRERQREYKMEVLDKYFDPPIIAIEEGDRIWWHWSKEKCNKPHCIYQVDIPPPHLPGNTPLKPVKTGFRWSTPSRSGLMSHEFFEPGVYYFSDHNLQESAEYIGTVIVRSKQMEHFVEITADGFSPDLIHTKTGDRIWWTWSGEQLNSNFLLSEINRCVSAASGAADAESIASARSFVDEELGHSKVAVGLETIQLNQVGVYQYKASFHNDRSTCSIIVNSGPKNYTVHVTDRGFIPKLVTVSPLDRIWWVWQDSKHFHSIIQVSHQGNQIQKGFASGISIDCPSAFMHQFQSTGIFYFVSEALQKAVGTVVVMPKPKVHEIQVTGSAITPDPCPIKVNDMVAWIFRNIQYHDVCRIESVDQVLEAQTQSPVISGRRCICRAFTETGTYHFSSKAFLKNAKKGTTSDIEKVSSIVVDKAKEGAIVRITAEGFQPETITVQTGRTVMWTWKGNEEAHNIVHINPPTSEQPLDVIQGSRSFNSGRPVSNNSFLHTFDEPGTYCLASQGAPGYSGTVYVLSQSVKTGTPYIKSQKTNGPVKLMHKVKLETETEDADIYYSVDGSEPELHEEDFMLYDEVKGIVLKKPGFCFVRAVAVSEGALNSEVFTSRRFLVLDGKDDYDQPASSDQESEVERPVTPQPKSSRGNWNDCKPNIKARLTGPGTLEVYWNHPPKHSRRLISGYQVFLNNVTYCEMFPPVHNKLTLIGLAGGRSYNIVLEVYPVDDSYVPYRSNQLEMHCPKVTNTGGPLISLEQTKRPDSLAVVWMSVSTPQQPIRSYKVYLNGQQCGEQVVPDAKSDRCMAIIQGCQLNVLFRIVVEALPREEKRIVSSENEEKGSDEYSEGEGNGASLMSNEIEVELPLPTDHINIHPGLEEPGDVDRYLEYIVVRDGGSTSTRRETPSEVDTDELEDTDSVLIFGGVNEENVPDAYSGETLESENTGKTDDESAGVILIGGQHDSEESEQEEETPRKTPESVQGSAQKESKPKIPESGDDEESCLEQSPREPRDSVKSSEQEEERTEKTQEPNDDVASRQEVDPRQTPVSLHSSNSDQEGERKEETPDVTTHQGSPEQALQPEGSVTSEPRDTDLTNQQGSPAHTPEPHASDAPDGENITEERTQSTDDSPKHTGKPRRLVPIPQTRGPEGVSEDNENGTGTEPERKPDDGDNISKESDISFTDRSGTPEREVSGYASDIEDGDRETTERKNGGPTVIPVQNAGSEPSEPGQPVVVLGPDDINMPVPVVTVESLGNDSANVRWHFKRQLDPGYQLTVANVNITGIKFQNEVNSDISFECLLEDDVPGIQHSWNVTKGSDCTVHGLKPGQSYNICIVATYGYMQGQQPGEILVRSKPIKYTTMGPPTSPAVSVLRTDINQAVVSWEESQSHREVHLTGYRVLVDGEQTGNILSKKSRETTIDSIQPGQTVTVNVIATTDHPVGDSEPGRTIKITCPKKPHTPRISQQPSYRKGSVIIGWEKPVAKKDIKPGEDIAFYRVFLDGSFHGEVKVSTQANINGYQYYLNDITPGVLYDVFVKAYAGHLKPDPGAEAVFCLCASSNSSSLSVVCPAPPTSPHLRLDGMDAGGIDVTWEMPEQYGDAALSGYQMMKNGKVYGAIIPPDVHNLRIKGLTLGERVDLQILALTNHPVGRDNRADSARDRDSPADGPSEIFLGDHYSACKPGPKLTVHYTGLVQPPSKVHSEQVTGHSALIVWNKVSKTKKHFVAPDNYQVTWWPGDRADEDINSQSTQSDYLLLTGLKPNTRYSVAVEARKMQKYSDIEKGSTSSRNRSDEVSTQMRNTSDEGYQSSFILTAQSAQFSLRTGRPPSQPSNLGVVATTCTSIQVSWDSPKERGAEVAGMRVHAVSTNQQDKRRYKAISLLPDATTAVIDGLVEKAEYVVTVTAVTEEFFDQLPDGHELKTTHSLPVDKPIKDDQWLPNSSVVAMTSGTDPPTHVQATRPKLGRVTLTWKSPKVYGSNRLQGTVVRWAEGRYNRRPAKEDPDMAQHKTITADSNEVTITDLHPGMLYKFVVEAVVSTKTTLEPSTYRDPSSEKQNRRTVHVMSKPVFVRTRAPCEPPRPIITGYTTNTVQLYWEKPLLYAVMGTDVTGNPKHVKLCLEGYRLEINGKPHMRIAPTAQSCTLVKCKPGKTYRVVLVALTCTEEVKRERKRRLQGSMGDTSLSTTTSGFTNMEWESSSDDFEFDESPSETREVTLPLIHDGFVCELNARYAVPEGVTEIGRDTDNLGDILVNWSLQGDVSGVTQTNVTWRCLDNGSAQQKLLDSTQRKCTIPVKRNRCLYEIAVSPQNSVETQKPRCQKIEILVPGAPDPPQIWAKSVSLQDFVIEWGEPKLYGVKLGGYQVYLNGKKVGSVLSSHHRKAIIPCKSRRQYKVNLVAMSADSRFGDSELSNTLLVHPNMEDSQFLGTIMSTQGEQTTEEEGYSSDADDFHVRVNQVTETAIFLDWSRYADVDGVKQYKVTWNSADQPNEREVKLPASEKTCVLHKCIPGTNHFVRVYALSKNGDIVDTSKLLTAQTSAQPSPPVVTLRSCNFNYVTVEWSKPQEYGDAKVTGYKVYVNGVVDGVLGGDTLSYNFTQGQWCREYVFQVQALTANEKLHSKPSDILVVTWPGVQQPALHEAAAVNTNTVRVVWGSPVVTEGVKIKQYKLIIIDEATERTAQIVSPIHPESTEAEIHNLKPGAYLIHLEVQVHGTQEVVKSDCIRIQPSITPDPPHIVVKVMGMEERRQLERIVCDIINERDRLRWILSVKEGTSAMKRDLAAERYGEVNEMLDDCLASLNYYTGHVLAHITWTCPQNNPDIRVTGYKCLVDGKQYGTTLRAGVDNVRIKLGLDDSSHKLSMVAVSDRPHAMSVESNKVEVLTEPFKPFSFYSFLSQEPKIRSGAPTYCAALELERKKYRKLIINPGLLKRHMPLPAVTLLNIFEGEYHPLFPPSGPKIPTALFFWTKWCSYSMRMLDWFVRFARNHSSHYDFVGISCVSGEVTSTDRQDLINVITENSWRQDGCLSHVCSHSLATTATISQYISETDNHECPFHHGEQGHQTTSYIDLEDKTGDRKSDVCDLLGVTGVPTLVIVHPEGYVAWRGRYCAADYQAFENFMTFIFAQSLGKQSPGTDPWDIELDVHGMSGSTMQTKVGDTVTTIHMDDRAGQSSSSKKLFVKSHKHKQRKEDKKLSVKTRPFSASASPYEEKLARPITHKGSTRRIQSGRKLKSTY